MKRWTWKIGIGLSLLLFLLAVTIVRHAGAETTPTPTPNVYGQISIVPSTERPEMYTDAFGNGILLDAADCAVGVVSFSVGYERAPEATMQEIKSILGWPDYSKETGDGALNLGRSGEIILDMNVYLRDSAGMFLYIFTTGQEEDRMSVSLSADCVKWYEVELKSKDFTGLDKYTNIPASVKPRYVKICDRSESGSGVCIDAVLAFDAEPIVKVVSGNAKREWYEKVGMTKKSMTVLCAVTGGILLLLIVLWIVRRINIFRRKRSRKLHLVYSRARDGAVTDNAEETRGGAGSQGEANHSGTGSGKKTLKDSGTGSKRKGKN